MKKLNILSAVLFVAVAGGICTSCADKLDLITMEAVHIGRPKRT